VIRKRGLLVAVHRGKSAAAGLCIGPVGTATAAVQHVRADEVITVRDAKT